MHAANRMPDIFIGGGGDGAGIKNDKFGILRGRYGMQSSAG